MEGARLLQKLRLTNLLSYGPEGADIELEPLNVLIGPNGSGKSNFVQAIGLLKAAPKDVAAPIRAGGGMPEWPWKGGGGSPAIDLEVEATVAYPEGTSPLRHRFQLLRVGQGLEVISEVIESEQPPGQPAEAASSFYSFDGAKAVLSVRQQTQTPSGDGVGRSQRHLDRRDLNPGYSILSQLEDPYQYPEITYLRRVYPDIQLFRTCHLGPGSVLLGPQSASEFAGFVVEDGSNLGMVINNVFNDLSAKKRILDELRRFYEPVEDLSQRVVANTIETLIHERGLFRPTPTNRLSDGTLRYLLLLAILCHPSPPPLICLEDPEIALHPDALGRLGQLLKEACAKTQLIVTTHSDALVSALSDVPEAVVICEKDAWGSHLRRLDPAALKEWLEDYTLGDLWRMGETGGNP